MTHHIRYFVNELEPRRSVMSTGTIWLNVLGNLSKLQAPGKPTKSQLHSVSRTTIFGIIIEEERMGTYPKTIYCIVCGRTCYRKPPAPREWQERPSTTTSRRELVSFFLLIPCIGLHTHKQTYLCRDARTHTLTLHHHAHARTYARTHARKHTPTHSRTHAHTHTCMNTRRPTDSQTTPAQTVHALLYLTPYDCDLLNSHRHI